MSTNAPVPKKKPQAADSRYVTILSDSANFTDITFKDAAKGLLPRSSKNYEVGIVNFTLKLSSFSCWIRCSPFRLQMRKRSMRTPRRR